MFEKNHKWLLASHLQKSIRRGWADEAAWAAGGLHEVDRSYLAYRLSVIAVEDVGAGDPAAMALWVDDATPWGARRFGKTDDKEKWQEVAFAWAKMTKDRTPCEWGACVYWLAEFEKTEQKNWQDIDPHEAATKAYDMEKPWWWRGLMAWRAAGTDRFPSNILPAVAGDWNYWVAKGTDDVQTVLVGLGGRQREWHPVFFPLAVSDRVKDSKAQLMNFDCGPILKSGPWIAPALDKHTAEGKRALGAFFRSRPKTDRDWLLNLCDQDQDRAMTALGTLMFWIEGGRVDRFWSYQTASKIDQDVKNNWQKTYGISGMKLLKQWGDLGELNKARGVSVVKTHANMP